MNKDLVWKIFYTTAVIGCAIVLKDSSVCWALAILVVTEIW